jgi:membrane AbrB-like protein
VNHLKTASRVAATLVAGLIGAEVCVWLKTPLPWMIGPLLVVAALKMADTPLQFPVPFRAAGQWIIGTSLGLYFTPAINAQLAHYLPWVIVSVLFAMAAGIGGGRLLQRMTGVDSKTAFFAVAIGGSSEMAVQAERNGGRVDLVAAAHSLRILMVVLIIPTIFRLTDVHGTDPYTPGLGHFDLLGLIKLGGLTALVGWFLNRYKIPNAWVIGPLLFTIALTAAGVDWTTLPRWIVNVAQLFIGCALGIRFTKKFIHTAPRYMAGVAVSVLLLMGVMAAFGYVLSLLSGIPAPTAVLATAPGGIAEMSLTAQVLHFGVPVVTVFHVTRVLVMVLSVGPLYRLMKPWLERDLPVTAAPAPPLR